MMAGIGERQHEYAGCGTNESIRRPELVDGSDLLRVPEGAVVIDVIVDGNAASLDMSGPSKKVKVSKSLKNVVFDDPWWAEDSDEEEDGRVDIDLTGVDEMDLDEQLMAGRKRKREPSVEFLTSIDQVSHGTMEIDALESQPGNGSIFTVPSLKSLRTGGLEAPLSCRIPSPTCPTQTYVGEDSDVLMHVYQLNGSSISSSGFPCGTLEMNLVTKTPKHCSKTREAMTLFGMESQPHDATIKRLS
jgi:hypothetical protein